MAYKLLSEKELLANYKKRIKAEEEKGNVRRYHLQYRMEISENTPFEKLRPMLLKRLDSRPQWSYRVEEQPAPHTGRLKMWNAVIVFAIVDAVNEMEALFKFERLVIDNSSDLSYMICRKDVKRLHLNLDKEG